jgi:hypothetical protein
MKKSTGYVINGVYYKEKPTGTVEPESRTYKSYSHNKQRNDHKRDIIQPYVNGLPNPAFIEQYHEESKNYGFIPKE